MSTFIVCSESIAGSGLLPEVGIRTPDCAAPRRMGQQRGSIARTQKISPAYMVRVVLNSANKFRLVRFDCWGCITSPRSLCLRFIRSFDTRNSAGRAKVDILFIRRNTQNRSRGKFALQPRPLLGLKIKDQGSIEGTGV